MSYLDTWNAMSAADAAAAVLPCCGSKAWASGLAARRPLATLPQLLAAGDAAWWPLSEADWQEAFDTHPRLGERHAQVGATATALAWSANEQSGLSQEQSLQQQLNAGNRAYEERFGRVFLIRASGRSSAEILAELNRRMQQTSEVEMQESAEQQREITHLRLQKWLHEEAAR